MNILITAGGTQEKIDQVRSITNTSTGETALGIAQFLYDHGYKNIYFVHSTRTSPFINSDRNYSFASSSDLEGQLKNILRDTQIDVIIHAAAVSDFVVDKVVINGELFQPEVLNKISSDDDVEIILKKRSKIIDQLKSFSKNNPLVIGFKLTNTKDADEQRDYVLRLALNEYIDFVVHNDLNFMDKENHSTAIYCKDQILLTGNTKKDLNENLFKIIREVAQ